MLKVIRKIFGKGKGKSVGCQADLTDYSPVFKSAEEMKKTNNDLLKEYRFVVKNYTVVGDQLQLSEELINSSCMDEKATQMERRVEQAEAIFYVVNDRLKQKMDKIANLKTDIEGTKYRLDCRRGPIAADLASREEREQIEDQLSAAEIAVQSQAEQNSEDAVVIESVQLLRDRMNDDHRSYVRQLKTELKSMKTKNAVMKSRSRRFFNTEEGKSELLGLFSVPKDEQEATKQRFRSLKKRKKALLGKINWQRQKKRALVNSLSRIRARINDACGGSGWIQEIFQREYDRVRLRLESVKRNAK